MIITPQIQKVKTFQNLLTTPFQGATNALCWPRQLTGDFAEIVHKIELSENMTTLDLDALRALELSERGELARNTILNDLKVLEAHGAAPTLNLIKHYKRDDAYPFFSTDVYSWHVDRSPVATDTFLCTYYGASSDILPNAQAEQKVLVPEIRAELKKLYGGGEAGFEEFLREYFFDLHYRAKPGAQPISLGRGNLWKLAIDHPESEVLPCVHRAPVEKAGEYRLLLIC